MESREQKKACVGHTLRIEDNQRITWRCASRCRRSLMGKNRILVPGEPSLGKLKVKDVM